jgi:hypothetical protein
MVSAATARVEISVMFWTMPMPVTSTAIRARAITQNAHIGRTGPARLLLHISGNLCARHQTPKRVLVGRRPEPGRADGIAGVR